MNQEPLYRVCFNETRKNCYRGPGMTKEEAQKKADRLNRQYGHLLDNWHWIEVMEPDNVQGKDPGQV